MHSSSDTSVVDWQDYYAQVGQVYDDIAEEYDATIAKSAVSRRAKQQALELIEHLTPPGARLLDIGCYTGEEALILARKGHHVLGTDISTRMVEIARKKAERARLLDRVRFVAMKASDISRLRDEGEERFHTAYSVYGTLNLEPRLDRVKEALTDLLKPNGAFVCGLINPTVLYELLAAPILMKFHGYRKLAKKGIRLKTGLGNQSVHGFLYSTQEFADLLTPEFVMQEALGIHFFYPPPRGMRGGKRWWIARALDSWEIPLQRVFPFRDLGFFSLLMFRRT